MNITVQGASTLREAMSRLADDGHHSKERTMKRKTIHLLLAALIGSTALSGCAYVKALNNKMKTPTVKFQNVELREATAQGIKLDFLFEVNNPNALGAKITSLSYDLKLNRSRIAKGTTKEAIEVGPMGRSDVRFPFELRFEDLVSTIKTLMGVRDKVKYELDIVVSIDTPIGEVELKRRAVGEFAVPKPKLTGTGFSF
tara:strand:+ start:872 stop:1468 length:597 start_codon:yes stop_codon:yes gene_type:complete